MANGKVSNLLPVGFNLLSESESFLTEMTHQELIYVNGGLIASDQPLPPSPISPVAFQSPLCVNPIATIRQTTSVLTGNVQVFGH